MAGVVALPPPTLARVPNVELIQTGTWNIASGTATFTSADLLNAVAALDCPAVRRPILKLGHDGQHGQGEPAVGYVDKLRVADDMRTLVGDLAGMPAWLADVNAAGESVLASAYPDRSIEGEWDYVCQMGHKHGFVVHALALLGTERQGVGTLQSLQDLYGVAASAGRDRPMARTITAGVTDEDVRRAFYADALGQDWDHWIVQMQLDPPTIIYVDDATGGYFSCPVTIGKGSGAAAVTFGEPTAVSMEFIPAKVKPAAGLVVRAQEAALRPPPDVVTVPPAATPLSPAAAGAGPATPDQEGSPAVPLTDETLTTLRQKLGTTADADEATILAALDQALTERADTPPQTPAPPADLQVAASTRVPPGTVVLDQETLRELQAAGRAGQAAAARLASDDRDRELEDAVVAGKIPRFRKQHWASLWDADPEGTRQQIASIPRDVVPTTPAGYVGDDGTDEDDPQFAGLFPPVRKAI